jgi:hypothetical protein
MDTDKLVKVTQVSEKEWYRDGGDPKTRENRARRMATRRGLRLVKSRRRDPRALDYGKYWIVNPRAPATAALGWAATPTAGPPTMLTPEPGMTLEQVEDWLTAD